MSDDQVDNGTSQRRNGSIGITGDRLELRGDLAYNQGPMRGDLAFEGAPMRGDVTYDRKRERAREEEREGMYSTNSHQDFHQNTSYGQGFHGSLPRTEGNLYSLPHQLPHQDTPHLDANGGKLFNGVSTIAFNQVFVHPRLA